MDIVKIDASCGRIVEFMNFSDQIDVDLNTSEQFPLIEGHPSPTSYYSSGEFVERPEFTPTKSKDSIQANGQDVLTITGVPKGECKIQLSGPVSDEWTQKGKIEITVDVPGAYSVRISQWPYIEKEIRFDAA